MVIIVVPSQNTKRGMRGVMETTQTFSGYDQSKVDELVRDAIDRAKGYYAYTHTSWLSNGGYEVTVQFKKKD